MLGTEPMRKVRIIILDERKQAVIAALHEMGIMDFRKSGLEITDDQPLAHYTELSDLIIKFEGAIKILPKSHVAHKEHMQLEKLLKAAREMSILDRIYGLENERKGIGEDQRLLGHAHYVADALSGLDINFDRLRSETLSFKAFETNPETLIKVENAIRTKRIQAEVIPSRKGKQVEALLAYEKTVKIDELLRDFKLKELDLGARYLEGTPGKALESINARTEKNKKRSMEIEREVAGISSREYSNLVNIFSMLRIELDRANASSIFKKTDRTVVIEGWIWAHRLDELKNKIRLITNGVYYLEEIKDKELAPTLVNRPKFLKPFDYMMDFFSVPRSDEIDPTWIFIVSFPIFYGLMVTDVGYGVLSFLLSTWITKITDPDGLVWNAAQIWKIGAVSAIVFGILTNQYFGIALNQYFLPFKGFDWIKNITYFVLLSVVFGLIQLNLGLLLGFINNYKRGHKLLAFSKLTSMSTLIFGVVFVGGAFFHTVGGTVTLISGVLGGISLVTTMVLSGSEAVEVTSLITHPLSYSRLMGFGLVSVILAFLIDKAFTPSLSHGILLFIVNLVIFLVLHTLNMIVSIFEGIVQGIRLNFVEFYTKFYIGSGVKFRPFGHRKSYAKV